MWKWFPPQRLTSHNVTTGHKQRGPEGQEDVPFATLWSLTVPEEAGSLSPARAWQKPGAGIHPPIVRF